MADGALLAMTLGASAETSIAKQAAKETAKELARIAAKEAVKKGVKTTFIKFAESAFIKFIRVLNAVDKLTLGIPSFLLRVGGKITNVALYLARSTIKVWSGLPTGFKKFVYKSFLAITISISIAFRTIPFLWNKFLEQIKKLLKELPGVIKEVFVNAPNDLFNALMTAIAEVFKEFGITVKIAYWMVLLVLIFMIYLFVPTKRLKYA